MKLRRNRIAAAGGAVLVGVLLAGAAIASGVGATLSTSQSITGDYFAAGKTVQLAGTVGGDIYAAGGTVTITGVSGGDILAAGGTLDLAGTVNGNVRAAGGQVTLESRVARNVTLGGGNIQIAGAGQIHGNLVAAGGSINVLGPIDGDARLAGGSVTLEGRIGGNVDVAAGQVQVGPGAVIAGNLSYTSKNRATIDPGAKITGTITHHTPPVGATGINWLWRVWTLLASLAAGLLLVLIFRQFSARAAESIESRPLAVLGWGVVALLVTPFVIVLLAITAIGIPLAVTLAAVYGIALFFSRLLVMLWAGRLVARLTGWKLAQPLAFVTGLVVYWLLQFVPVLGSLTVLATVIFGLGTLVVTLRQYHQAATKTRPATN